MEIKIDFVADLARIARANLMALGCTVPASDDKAIVGYLNVSRRRIEPRARAIKKSADFACPAEVAPGLAELELKLIAGHDVNPHHSKSISKTDYQDPLFNDWGIVHLHLGLTNFAGQVGRTGPVLFALVEEHIIYMIDIAQHGRGHDPWHRQELVRTIHANWPEAIRRHRLEGVTADRMEDSTIKGFRKMGANVLIAMEDGTAYAPLGGGQTAAGTSTRGRIEADRARYMAREWQKWVLANIELLRDVAKKHGSPMNPPLCFELVELTMARAVMREINSGFTFDSESSR